MVVSHPEVACPHCGAMNPAGNRHCFDCKRSMDPNDPGDVPDDGSDDEELDLIGPTAAPEGPTPPSRVAAVNSVAPLPAGSGAVELRCASCGAPLEPAAGALTVRCTYCGTTLSLPAPPSTSPPFRPSFNSEDDDDEAEEEEDRGVGVWGYRRRKVGPGRSLVGGIFLVVLGLGFLAWGLSASWPSCTTDDFGTQQVCTNVPNDGIAAIGGFWLLLGLCLVLWYGPKVRRMLSDPS